MELFDTIILGSGPAGLTAAIYAARDNLKTLVVGGSKWGGQLMLTTEVENYPGFSEGILGPELMNNFKKQAERFGVEVKLVDATKVDFSSAPFRVWTAEGDEGSEGFVGKTVIIATGADTKWLGIPNEQRLIGKGVSSCAPCDAFFFKGKRVFVVGGGDAAMEEVLTLSKFATSVTIVHRRDSFRASKIMQQKALSFPNVSVIWNSEVVEVLGDDRMEGVKLKNVVDGQVSKEKVDGLFVAIGHSPNTKIFAGQVALDQKGYVLQGGGEEPFPTSTSVPGVFVAGDVHDHHYRQAVTAAAFGCMAAIDVSKFLSNQKISL